MMRFTGHSVTDLMDLQLGLTELKAIGFSHQDLYSLGLTEEMCRPPSIYALLLTGLQSFSDGSQYGNDEDDDDGGSDEADYYL